MRMTYDNFKYPKNLYIGTYNGAMIQYEFIDGKICRGGKPCWTQNHQSWDKNFALWVIAKVNEAMDPIDFKGEFLRLKKIIDEIAACEDLEQVKAMANTGLDAEPVTAPRKNEETEVAGSDKEYLPF